MAQPQLQPSSTPNKAPSSIEQTSPPRAPSTVFPGEVGESGVRP